MNKRVTTTKENSIQHEKEETQIIVPPDPNEEPEESNRFGIEKYVSKTTLSIIVGLGYLIYEFINLLS